MTRRWNLVRHGFYLLAGLMGLGVGLGLVSGCQTIAAGGIPAIEVILTSDGNAQVGSDLFPVKELARRLMREGAGRETAVFVVVPPDMTPSAMSGILRELHTSGFRKAMFKRPLKPDATINYKGASR